MATLNLDAQKSLNDRELSILYAELMRRKKSTLATYLLWFFAGQLGAHNFYMGKLMWGLIYIALLLSAGGFIAAEFSAFFVAGFADGVLMGVGGLLMAVLTLLMVWDLFTIPMQLGRRENRIKEELLSGLLSNGSDIG